MGNESKMIVNQLRCEFIDNPIGIDEKVPRFSWKLISSDKCVVQKAYRIMISSSKEKLEKDDYDLWDSKKVLVDKQANIKYEGKELLSRMQCFWKVKVWNNKMEVVESDINMFEMSFLLESDWKAKWICMKKKYRASWSPIFRKEFSVKNRIKKARAYICGLGYYELTINGKKVSDHVLSPAQTDYEEKVFYITHDISVFLKSGKNAIGVMLGDGFYSQSTVWGGTMAYGIPRLICQIEIEYFDGEKEIILTDESWKCNHGPISRNNVYTGETYDARLEESGWNEKDFDDSRWYKVDCADGEIGKLTSQKIPPTKRMDFYQAVSIKEVRRGIYVFDIGQNIAGYARLVVDGGKAGTEITMRYAETVDENGYINTDTTGTHCSRMPQTDRYILKGDGEEIYEPRFTYSGFRYVEVTGLPFEPRVRNIEGIAVYTSLDNSGDFLCSDKDVNILYRTMEKTIKSNIQGTITDCPAREKCQWLGDAMIMTDTIMYNLDSILFWEKVVKDIETTKNLNGKFKQISPGKRLCGDASPAWGTAIVKIPWLMYKFYDDINILKEQYENMKEWTMHLYQKSENGLLSFGLGDWCQPNNQKEVYTNSKFISTLYYYMSALIVSKVSSLLDNEIEEKWFGDLVKKIKKAINKRYYDYSKHTYGTQTSDSFALYLGIVPNEEEALVAKSIADDLVKRKYHLTTGHIGVRYVFEILTKYGFGDIAFRTIKERSYPSFMYQIDNGATTLWETWEGLRQSLNHPFKGGYAYWLYANILGIKPILPGFKEISIKPNYLNGMKWAKGEYDSIYGKISVDWKINENALKLNISIPTNTKAKVYLPKVNRSSIYENNISIEKIDMIELIEDEKNVKLIIGSGSYRFTCESAV